MFAKILAAIDDLRQSQVVLDMVKGLATAGSTQVHIGVPAPGRLS